MALWLSSRRLPKELTVIDPEKIPDIRPDRRRFWLLRFLNWLSLLVGLVAVAYGCLLGAVAYYATKNGGELPRMMEVAPTVLIAVIGGVLTMTVGQVFRVIIAIEENTRLIAFHTRPRPKPPEPPRRPAVPPVREQMRV